MASAGIGSTPRDCVRILGVPIDRVTVAQTLATIESFIAQGGHHLVVTADATGLVIAHQNPDFLELVCKADLVTPDGSGVLWAAQKRGEKLVERVSGVDMVDCLSRLSADKGYRLYFLGAAPGVAELAAEKLTLKYPGCNIVGTRHGYFPAESDEVVAREIAATKPDVLFVGLGMPRQEQFIQATRDIVGAKVSMGIGGSFDVFSGKTKRAPMPFRRLHLEWLWRLMLNPRKIAKVKMLPKFVVLVLREKR